MRSSPAPERTPLSVPMREVVIRGSRGFVLPTVDEFWAYRELFYFLAWRDVIVRYKQTLLGVMWAILQPALTMVVFSLFFGYFAGVPSDGVSYPLFSLTGLVPWTFFSSALSHSAGSLVSNQDLIKKVFFPRALIPLGAVLATVVDFTLGLLMLMGVLLGSGVELGLTTLWLLPLSLLTAITAAGAGLFLSALNVRYRDVQYALPFLLQLWLFVTPVAYPSSMLPEPWRTIYGLNPMVGVIEGFRWVLLGQTSSLSALPVSTATAVLVLLIGFLYFKQQEKFFADVV